MKSCCKFLGVGFAALLVAGMYCAPVHAQDPVVVAPIVVDTAVPIIVRAVKPKQPAGSVKFEGFIMNANIAQITAWAKGNETAIMTFPLTKDSAAKMQQIVDKGGYQYGDKVTIYYDPATQQVIKFRGKPSKPI